MARQSLLVTAKINDLKLAMSRIRGGFDTQNHQNLLMFSLRCKAKKQH